MSWEQRLTRGVPEYSWRDGVRETVRGLVAPHGNRHVPGDQPDIALLSSPRSGSTWLMESLATQPGYKSIDEPDHKAMLEFHRRLHIRPRWNWVDLTEEERRDFGDFLLDDRRSGIFGPVRPREVIVQRHTHRRVLKLVRSGALTEWVADLGLQTVYLVRHPIPQSLSCIARGHRVRVQDFLDADQFVARLTPAQRRLAETAVAEPRALDSYVTQWCLENLVPLTSDRLGSTITLSTYEDRVMDAEGEAERLAAILGVADPAAMAAYASTPSRVTNSSSVEAREQIRSGRAAALLAAWHEHVDAADEARVMGIVEEFGLSLYRAGSDLPEVPAAWV